MRKEFMVKEQVGELGKKTHPMDDQTRLGATSSEVMGRKEDFLAMMGLWRSRLSQYSNNLRNYLFTPFIPLYGQFWTQNDQDL
jgi:hypothetical protein